MNKRTTINRCRGFTLLELVVVVAIITALAGLLVLVLPDLMFKTNNARMLANLTEMDKIIQSYYSARNGIYPTGYDSLLNAADGTTLYKALPVNSSGKVVGGYLTPKALTAEHVKRLARAGITTVYDMADPAAASTDGRNATYKAGNTLRTTAENQYLSFVTPQGGNKIKFDATHEYIALGIGHNCTLVGSGGMVKEPPVVLHPEGCADPSKTYCAVVALFDLGDPTKTTVGAAATFIGCVAVADSYFRFSEEITNVNYNL